MGCTAGQLQAALAAPCRSFAAWQLPVLCKPCAAVSTGAVPTQRVVCCHLLPQLAAQLATDGALVWESRAAGSGAAGSTQLRLGRQSVESVLHVRSHVEVKECFGGGVLA